ncbi:unnamed protein product, partial [Trichogramma brassicae]
MIFRVLIEKIPVSDVLTFQGSSTVLPHLLIYIYNVVQSLRGRDPHDRFASCVVSTRVQWENLILSKKYVATATRASSSDTCICILKVRLDGGGSSSSSSSSSSHQLAGSATLARRTDDNYMFTPAPVRLWDAELYDPMILQLSEIKNNLIGEKLKAIIRQHQNCINGARGKMPVMPRGRACSAATGARLPRNVNWRRSLELHNSEKMPSSASSYADSTIYSINILESRKYVEYRLLDSSRCNIGMCSRYVDVNASRVKLSADRWTRRAQSRTRMFDTYSAHILDRPAFPCTNIYRRVHCLFLCCCRAGATRAVLVRLVAAFRSSGYGGGGGGSGGGGATAIRASSDSLCQCNLNGDIGQIVDPSHDITHTQGQRLLHRRAGASCASARPSSLNRSGAVVSIGSPGLTLTRR